MKFWQRCIAVFAAMLALDIVFALYVITTAEKNALMSSVWAGGIQVFNIFVVSAFVKDRRMAIPCVLGAFVGTYIAVAFI